MKIAKLLIMSCLACIYMMAYSAVYAQGNDSSIFLEGRIANSESFLNCSGTCSADPGGTLEIGFTRNDFAPLAGIIFSPSVSLGYSRNRFVINGTALDVTEKGIYVHLDFALQSHPEYVFSARNGLGWITSRSMNLPDRTVFGGVSGIDLIYRVAPDFNVLIGVSALPVFPSNQADFFSRTVDIGLRWYLF